MIWNRIGWNLVAFAAILAILGARELPEPRHPQVSQPLSLTASKPTEIDFLCSETLPYVVRVDSDSVRGDWPDMEEVQWAVTEAGNLTSDPEGYIESGRTVHQTVQSFYAVKGHRYRITGRLKSDKPEWKQYAPQVVVCVSPEVRSDRLWSCILTFAGALLCTAAALLCFLAGWFKSRKPKDTTSYSVP